MGRHSTTTTDNRRSSGLIVAVITVAMLLATGLWWFVQRETAEPPQAASQDCTVVPVASVNPRLGDLFAAQWSRTDADDCVEIDLVEAVEDAALLLAPQSPATEQLLSRAGRNLEGSAVAVASTPVGLAGASATHPSEVEAADISFPVKSQPEAAVLVAGALGHSQVAGSLTEKEDATWIATAEDAATGAMTFTAIDNAALVYFAQPLSPHDEISPQQADAARRLASRAGENYEGPPHSNQTEEQLWAEAGFGDTAPQRETIPNILFLLDTSESMAPFYGAAAEAIGSAAVSSTEAGSHVALWNYSSPLTPGVTQGWRTNVGYTAQGHDVDLAVKRFGLGGQPQSRVSLVAALSDASSQAAASGDPVRVVLVTTGTQDGMNEEQFKSALENIRRDAVSVTVIHVGQREPDSAIKDVADSFTRVAEGASLLAAVKSASGL